MTNNLMSKASSKNLAQQSIKYGGCGGRRGLNYLVDKLRLQTKEGDTAQVPLDEVGVFLTLGFKIISISDRMALMSGFAQSR